MQKGKVQRIALYILAGVFLDIAFGRLLGSGALPFWFNSFGTAVVACACGPVWGAVVGAASCVLRGVLEANHSAIYFAFAGAATGAIIGVCAQKKMFFNAFGAFTAAFIAALAASVLALPVNLTFIDGNTGNMWGDGVISMLAKYGMGKWSRCLIGLFYVEYVDKLATLLALDLVMRARRKILDKRAQKRLNTLAGVLLIGAALGALAPLPAAEAAVPDYGSYLQTTYNNENGLVGGTANDIAETADGALWVGTYGGLYRYNGKDFERLDGVDSVKNVNCLCVDSQDRLWVGSNDGGLTVYSNGKVLSILNDLNGLPSNVVRCIAASTDGSYYYVGTTDSLALVTLADGGLSVSATVPEVAYAESISVNDENIAAAVTESGSLYLLSGSGVIASVQCPEAYGGFTCCLFTDANTLYAGTTGGDIVVYAVRGNALSMRRVITCGSLSGLKSMRMSTDGQLIICADNGIGCINTSGEFSAINTANFDSSIDHMIFDYQGNLWFTSSRLGLLKLSPSMFTELYSKIWLEESVVNAITMWRGNFYFGTDSGLDMANSTITQATENWLTRALEGVRVRALFVDNSGNLWICTTGSGAWCVEADGSCTVYTEANGAQGNRFRSALELSDGTILLTGDSGLTYIKDGKVTKNIGTADGLSNPRVLCALELSDGTILAGTNGGGISVVKDGKVTGTLTKSDGLASEVIMRMVPDEESGGVFIVTGSDLCFMDAGGEISRLDNFPYYNNYDVIAGRDGTLFVTGSAGIYIVDREALLNGDTLNYTLLNAQDGLRSSLTANSWSYVDRGGNLYLAGDTGVIKVNMTSYKVTCKTYCLSLHSVVVDDVDYTVTEGETLYLPRGSKRVVLTPEVINYSTSNPTVEYYLEGYDDQPYTTGISGLGDVVYTNLPAGNYVFHIQVLDDAGEIVGQTECSITKAAEIYEEPWFVIYLFLVFLLIVCYIVWAIFRITFKHRLDMQEQELKFTQKQLEMSSEAILTIARTVDARNPSTGQHSFRVAQYSLMIAQRLGLSKKECEELQRAALLHDIGKVGIPDSILNKPGRLTDEEYALMKTHVTMGAEILKNFTFMDHIVDGALYHHERYDGKGYMKGLKGTEIPLYARIIGVADAFDAMTSVRVYKQRQSIDYVISELERGRGAQFDPELAQIMLDLIAEGKVDVDEMYRQSQLYSQENTIAQAAEAAQATVSKAGAANA